MERSSKSLKTILAELGRSTKRSTMFWWMYDNHEEIVRSLEGRRIGWAIFTARMTELGLKDGEGQDPKPHTARITWSRVRKAVREAASYNRGPDENHVPERRMPCSSDARPVLVEGRTPAQIDLVANGDRAAETDVVRTTVAPASTIFLDAPADPVTSQPPSQCLVPVAASVAPRAQERPPATPEQVAHREVQIAKAYASLGFIDRFINIKE